jgi:hypothetical protein
MVLTLNVAVWERVALWGGKIGFLRLACGACVWLGTGCGAFGFPRNTIF